MNWWKNNSFTCTWNDETLPAKNDSTDLSYAIAKDVYDKFGTPDTGGIYAAYCAGALGGSKDNYPHTDNEEDGICNYITDNGRGYISFHDNRWAGEDHVYYNAKRIILVRPL